MHVLSSCLCGGICVPCKSVSHPDTSRCPMHPHTGTPTPRPLLTQVLVLLKRGATVQPAPIALTAACVRCVAAAAHTATTFVLAMVSVYESLTGAGDPAPSAPPPLPYSRDHT